jgi:hypothetical protein
LNRVKDSTGAHFFQRGTTAPTSVPPSTDTVALTGSTTAGQGNLSQGTTFPNEFNELYLQINRLSNLITTHSDTYTVYIVIEGWQNAGDVAPFNATTNPPPTPVLTRRSAFIVDRNSVTPLSRAVKTVTVPNN